MTRALVGEYTAHFRSLECTAYATEDATTRELTIHTITRGGATFNRSRPVPVPASADVLAMLRSEAERFPLF